jgi:GT2 family glycosyltransferase
LTNDVDQTAELYQSLLREKTARPHAIASARTAAHAVARHDAASAVRRPRLAAVILNYQTPAETILAAKALLASDRPIDHLIVVDNSPADSRTTLSPADSRASLTDSDAWRSIASRVHLIQNDANLGFSGGMNVGIRAALAQGAERVLLVNSDVVFPPDAIARLERSLAASAGAGICGPVVVSRSMPDRIASRGMRYRSDNGRMRHLAFNDATASSSGAGDEAEAVDAVSGCAMLIIRKVFDAIGLFDEAYFFSFEDLDFCLRARRAGYATILSAGATVHHEGGQSIGPASPRRLYFAARNHLRLARQVDPDAAPLAGAFRTGCIVLLNFAHATRCREGSPLARWTAVIRGIRDYARGRFGTDLPGSSD